MKTFSLLIFLVLSLPAFSQEKKAITIYFEFDRDQLTAVARERLDSFIRSTTTGWSASTLEIHGHCDAVGSDAYNEDLSFRRAMTVKQYLVSRQVPVQRVQLIKAHGEQQPLVPNSSARERQWNRRVELVILQAAAGEAVMEREAGKAISLEEKIADTSLSAGSNIVLKNINFYGGRHQFLPESRPMLDELLQAMRNYPRLVIEIQGHICCESHPGDGMDLETGQVNLSLARARAIRDFLVEQGIEPGRVSYKGFGHSRPIYPYPEQSDEERVANRRVEIRIIRK